jgi:uncharacterized membrane protein
MSNEEKQSTFVIVYKGQDTADKVYDTLRELQKQKKIEIKTAAVVTRKENGKLKLNHKRRVTVGKGIVGGGALGLLILGPGAILAGAVVGGVIGSSRSGERRELKEFLDDKLGQDESALAILISDADWEAVRAATEAVYGRGEVLTMELTPETEAELNALTGDEEVTKAIAEEVEVVDDPDVEVVTEAEDEEESS